MDAPEFPALIADRYAFEEVIGRGGMASVARVVDRTTGDRVALKRMRAPDNAAQAERARMLFEREYRTLCQLAHPRIVQVFDYGHDGDVPFYTMELLDGGDLSEQAPIPWQRACALARDVCAALSLVHARAMVYRDLSLRNVRCTSDGKAKLLDFGAMAPAGSAKFAVCTPSVAAPEVVHMQALDARTDLYALGATLYHALTGSAAYGANSFRQLELFWKHSPVSPGALVPGIPEALDGLVMDLIQLDPRLRPASAAEVGERLRAIAGLPEDGHAAVSAAYLTTPTLMGRDAELQRIQRRLHRLSADARGGAMTLHGRAGTGRSRLLDACVLQAKLDGHLVLRASGADGGGGAGHPMARALCEQLLNVAPAAALGAAESNWDVLSQLLPRLGEAGDRPVGALDADSLQALAVRSLCDWLLAVSAHEPLLLAIDDVERLDVDSRNLVALLAERARRHPLLMLVARTAGTQGDCAALSLLDGSSRAVVVKALSHAQCTALAGSVFGEVPYLSVLVDHLHALTEGNPRDFMLVAQHLVDHGIVERRDGHWVIPPTLQGTTAPASMEDALRAQIAALTEGARELAQALSLSDPLCFDFDECLALGATPEALTELLKFSVLRPIGSAYQLSPAGFQGPLLEGLSEERARELHRRLSAVMWARGDGFRATRHDLAAGDDGLAVEHLVQHSRESSAITDVDPAAYAHFLEGLPGDWADISTRVLALIPAGPEGRPLEYAVRNRVLGIYTTTALGGRGQSVALARMLAQEAGLDLYDAMEAETDAGKRLQAAIGGAMQRHAERPAREQVCDPIAAIRHLARTTIAAIGSISNSFDFVEWEAMPSLGPLTPLSPALAVVHQVAVGFDARRRGRYPQALAVYEDVLERIAPPNDIGLEHTYVVNIRAGIHSIAGIIEASLGKATWERHAVAVADNPLHEPNAALITSLATLWQGDAAGHARLEHARERLRLEQRRSQPYEPVALVWRFQAHAVSEDLTATAQALLEFERFAEHAETWQPLLAWARGEYERVRGDHEKAVAHFDTALRSIEAGRHQLWPQLAASRLLSLCALGRQAQALQEGEAQLQLVQQHDLQLLGCGIRMSVAIAAARMGEAQRARDEVAAFMAELQQQGVTGLNLGLAHEAAASVALYLRDVDAFEVHAARCQEIYSQHANRALSAKYQRLMRAGRRIGLITGESTEAPEVGAEDPVVTEFASILETCSDPQEGVVRSMEFMVEQCEASGAYLLTPGEGDAELSVQVGAHPLPSDVRAAAVESLQGELEDTDVTGEDSCATAFGTAVAHPVDQDYQQLLVGHYRRQGFVVSGLLLLRTPKRDLERGPQLAIHLSRFIETAKQGAKSALAAQGSA